MKNILNTRVLIIVLSLLFMVFLVFTCMEVKDGQQHTLLAKAFISGRINIDEPEGEWMRDTVLVDGKYYWHLGPFPAVILTIPVFIFDKMGLFFYQGYLQFFLNLVVFYLCYHLARKYAYDKTDALFLAFAFVFASVYFLAGLFSTSWPFTQVVTVTLLLLALNVYFRASKNYLLIGILFACIFATRFSAGLGIVFFILSIITQKSLPTNKKIKYLIYLLMPIVISGILLLSYNQARFGNYFDNGYTKTNNWKYSQDELKSFMPYGLFNIKYVPNNIRLYFLRLPEITMAYPYLKVVKPGVSFFVVSPIFLYIFLTRPKTKETKFALITALIILVLLLAYYYSGWEQIGPRYTLDFLPYLFIILLGVFKANKLSNLAKTIIVVSALLNLYLINAFI